MTSNSNHNRELSYFEFNDMSPEYSSSSTIQPSMPSPMEVFAYSYIYYFLLILLIFLLMACIQMCIRRRSELQRLTTLRSQRSDVPAAQTIPNSSVLEEHSCHMGGKEWDFPPTYDEVMKAVKVQDSLKQQQQNNNKINRAETMNDIESGIVCVNVSSGQICSNQSRDHTLS